MSDDPTPEESQVRLYGYDVSVRGLMSIICTASLCILTFKYPEVFSKAFESISIAIVAFYFGQNSKK